MSKIEEAEYQRLAEAVRATEKLAVDNPHIRSDATALLEPLKHRMEHLEHEVFAEGGTDKKDKKSADSMAIAALVNRETRLNAEEKEAYAGFLEKDYFTKKDFKELDSFYATSYDKLSEEGKVQMSERVLEGIRRGEYTMSDLPESVQEPTREYVKSKGGNTQNISSRDSSEKDTKGLSQVATERSEVAEAAENFAEGDKDKTETEKSAAKDSDLSKIANISPVELSLPAGAERQI